MGWASGESIIFDVWEAVREYIPEEKRVGVVGKIMKPFFDHDWDTEDDFLDTYPEAKEAMRQLYPKNKGIIHADGIASERVFRS